MKKVLLVLALCVFSVSNMNAQNRVDVCREGHQFNLSAIEKMATKSGNYQYKMSSYATDDNYLDNKFYYDDAHRLVAVKQEVDYVVIDSLFYNQDNQLVKLSGWQLLNGQFENVYYIDYTYDEHGNLATRTNYNYFDDWVLGGVYNFSYNENNQIVVSELVMSGIVYMRVDYTYVNGLLDNEVWSSYDGNGVSPAEKVYYFYQDGILQTKRDSILGTYNWELYFYETYTYDAQGNCTEKHKYDQYNNEVERSIYVFETRLMEETLIPSHFELDRPHTYNNVNTYTTEQWYSVDDNFDLQYICDYIYTYIPINSNGINTAKSQTFNVVPNPAKDMVSIECNTLSETDVQVVDVMGRVVMTATVSSSNTMLDISALPTGTYILRLLTKEGIKVSKLVVE